MRVYYLKCQPSARGNYWLIRLNVILEESSYARLDSKLLRVCDQYLREAFRFSEKGNGKKTVVTIYICIYICQIIKAKISPTMTGGIDDL